MASITSAGIGSGLDVNSIVTQLMAVERQPLSQMQSQADDLQTKVSAYGKLQSYLSSFRDAAANLSQSATWKTVKVSSADDTSVSVSGSASSGAAGSYSVSVSKLAASQTVASAAQASKTDPLGATGTLTLQVGTWGTQFDAQSGKAAVTVDVTATDTLSSLRDKINASNTDIQATIVTDASGSRLVTRSTASGTANGFKITATDSSLAAFTFTDPAEEATSGVKKLTLAAADAEATINGLSIKSSSNVLTDVVDGVSLKLSKVTTAPVDVTVQADTDTLQTALTNFAKSYNDLASYLTSQTKYDATAKKGGTFQGDSAVNSIRSALRALGSSSAGTSSVLTRLSDVGLDVQTDGTLKTNSTKMSAALTKVDDLRQLFVGTASTDGLAAKMRSWGDSMLSTDGAITTRQSSLQTQITSNSKQQSDFQDRMTLVEKRMRDQYTALDTQMAKINSMSNYVTQQLRSLSSSGN